MNDSEAYYIPQTLDEPEKVLFWSSDEIIVMVVPIFVIGIGFSAFTTSLFFSAISLYWWKRFKGSEQANLHLYALYWFYPSGVMRLKATPKSYVKTYFG